MLQIKIKNYWEENIMWKYIFVEESQTVDHLFLMLIIVGKQTLLIDAESSFCQFKVLTLIHIDI